ncbi:DNA-binding helix-hairpin-helix protein with protein kinase domain [Mucilaginibacter frigoritolerans]|uniref:DNA-binding helix-hairpin-helix protein with protein kinase domain n=1 Tax=Mucilaginibacter frigoritolerans TaxID=652788 RepID=A0A562TU43_9SPHI|nr:protein kinase [Mucilaginibacter frigoritolerans]TWI96768.1 DNA-binding helix-hairpin-helix protein with protein kinase domain [Mucilaginibacter frigoritolerans]
MAGLIYNGLKGDRYVTGRRIGEGGEGIIYEVQGSTEFVIKVYKEKTDRDKEDKLIFMASMAMPELLKFAAWPVDVIRDAAGQVAGFVMKKLVSFVPLHMLFNPMDRKRIFPDKGYNFLIHVARNLAIAFHQIHQQGIVVGDVNEANILVSNTGMVVLIDCDSFQVKNGSRYHFCEVGIPRYTPPELLEKGSFEQVVRTINTDSFSLATLIFQLIFLGRAPFTGINLSKEDFEEDKAIRLGEFAYSLRRSNKKLSPAKYSLDLNTFTPGVINDFHEAFENRVARPTPIQWINDLENLSKEIRVCDRSGLHFYPRGLSKCPWCTFKEQAGIIYFFDDTYLHILPELKDIEQFVNGYRLEKIEIKRLPDTFVSGSLAPTPIPQQFFKSYYIKIAVLICLLLLIIGLCFTPFWYCTPILFSHLIFKKRLPYHVNLDTELTQREITYERLNAAFLSLVNKHNSPAELKRYNQSASKLSDAITQLRRLPEDLIIRKKKIEEKYYHAKYQVHLQQFDIGHYPIPSFGLAKKQLIQKNGIKTAADLFKLKSVKISGIGPKNIQILFDWQRHIGTGFVYIPDTAAIDREMAIAANQIFVEKLKLQNIVKKEYQEIVKLKDSIITTNDQLEKQYITTGKKLYQAQLDLNAFKKLANKWF